jgi:hypothetical protein
MLAEAVECIGELAAHSENDLAGIKTLDDHGSSRDSLACREKRVCSALPTNCAIVATTIKPKIAR